MAVFTKFVHFFTTITKWVGFWSLVIMMLMVTVFSISRFFGYPIVGDVELVQFGMVVTIMGSLSYTQSTNSHVAIGIIVDRFPASFQRIIDIIANILVFIFCILVAWVFVAKLNFSQTSQLLAIPFSPFKIFLSLSFLGWGLEALLKIFKLLGEFKTKTGGDRVAS